MAAESRKWQCLTESCPDCTFDVVMRVFLVAGNAVGMMKTPMGLNQVLLFDTRPPLQSVNVL